MSWGFYQKNVSPPPDTEHTKGHRFLSWALLGDPAWIWCWLAAAEPPPRPAWWQGWQYLRDTQSHW